MATKEELQKALSTIRAHHAKIIARAALVEQLADAYEDLLGEEESFKGEFAPESIVPVGQQRTPLNPRPSNGSHPPQISEGSLFGKSIGEAATEVLRVMGKPMGMKDMVGALETANFQFESKDHYFSLYRAMRDDRRPSEIVKQGKLYGLRPRTAKRAIDTDEEQKSLQTGHEDV